VDESPAGNRGSRAGYTAQETMISRTLALIAASYWYSSIVQSDSLSTLRVAGRRSVFWARAAAHKPGKCLAAAATPCCCCASMKRAPRSDTTSGSELYERSY